MKILLIAIFGLLGVFARYFTALGVNRFFSLSFPLGTFLINMSGSFAIGIIYVVGVEKLSLSEDLRIGLMVGFLGGFTTFSAYCIETARLIEEAKYFYAAAYFGLSPLVGLLAVFGGLIFARFLTGGRTS